MISLIQSKEECFGCELCKNVCPRLAITMKEDAEGFRYPQIEPSKCIECHLCEKHCPAKYIAVQKNKTIMTFGGYCKDEALSDKSTSGGIFSAVANTWCDENTNIFGAEAIGLNVRHVHLKGLHELNRIRKSKYSQSDINGSYSKVKKLLDQNEKVLFSGTPCQIAALWNYPGMTAYRDSELLLTIEVVCDGFPSPLLLRKYVQELEKKYGSKITELDYRYKDGNRWDFQVMRIVFENGKIQKTDRWFSPFYILWSDRLMSRPSCIVCPFRTNERLADITLGDLWGVHIYCPDLYNNNKGTSLILCNTQKGLNAFNQCKEMLKGHELDYNEAIKYQRPLRTIVPAHKNRDLFMKDLQTLSYNQLIQKYKPHSSVKLLVSKYIWGSNRQKVAFWKLRNKKDKQEKP